MTAKLWREMMPNYTSDLVADKITKRLWNNLTGGGA